MFNKIALITVMDKESTRFPGKNTYPFLGKMLYRYTVDFALSLGYDYHLIISDMYKAIALPRAQQLHVHSLNMARLDVSKKIAMLSLDADIYVLLQVTSPFRGNDFEYALQDFKNSYSECAVAVKSIANKYCYVHNDPVNFLQSCRTYDGCNRSLLRIETGGYYFFRKEQLTKQHILQSTPDKIMLCEDSFNIDIDTIDDLRNAEKEYSR